MASYSTTSLLDHNDRDDAPNRIVSTSSTRSLLSLIMGLSFVGVVSSVCTVMVMSSFNNHGHNASNAQVNNVNNEMNDGATHATFTELSNEIEKMKEILQGFRVSASGDLVLQDRNVLIIGGNVFLNNQDATTGLNTVHLHLHPPPPPHPHLPLSLSTSSPLLCPQPRV